MVDAIIKISNIRDVKMAENELKKKGYIDRLIEIAQDRRYSTAIDLWAAILLTGQITKDVDLKGETIVGITAKDIAKILNMKIGSVYHNLKILQSDKFQFFETSELKKESKAAGRKVTQIVYRVPKAYNLELEVLLKKQSDDGNYKRAHQEITYFNLLKLRGILALYASMLHSDRTLVTNKTEEHEDWYEKWMDPVKFEDQIASPGIVYTTTPEKMEEILTVINKCCYDKEKKIDKDKEKKIDKGKEKEKDKKKEDKGPWVQFSYLVFPSETEEMKTGDWVLRKEFEKRKKTIPEKESTKEIKECEKDHHTLFKYGLACPVCKKKPPKL